MKNITLALLLTLGTSTLCLAQTSFDTAGIPTLKKAVVSSFVKTQQTPSCPAAGTVSFDKVSQSTDSATSSVDAIARLVQNVTPQRDKLNVDSSRCGQCQQVNQVAIYTTSEPNKVSKNSMCDNRPTVNIQKVMASQDIENFANSTLRGNTPEGKSLYQGCPDPCSFYVASASTDRGNNQSLLNMTVHCGQPRNGSLLFAKYKYSAGLVQSWTCR